MAWRATDSLAVRSFLRLAVDEAPPDHSTIARTRRLIDLETHRAVFTWVQQRLVEAGRLTGKTIAIDATTLEANAAMRSIVRRDTGESYQAFLAGLVDGLGDRDAHARGSGATGSEAEEEDLEHRSIWRNPHDPGRAKVTKMKDGRTHLATPSMPSTWRPGDCRGDTARCRCRRHHDDHRDRIAAAEQVEDAQAQRDDRQSLDEIVGDPRGI